MPAIALAPAAGRVSSGFEAVREAFEENFARRGELGGDWGKSSAAATVTMVPIIIVGFFVQKYIAQGTTAGAVKG